MHSNIHTPKDDPDALADAHSRLNALSEILRLPTTERDEVLAQLYTLLDVSMMHPDSIAMLAGLFRSERLDIADFISEPHEASVRASDKQAFLQDGENVQKTVSLLLNGKKLLVTTIGVCTIDTKVKRAILEALGLPLRKSHSFRFNPASIVPEEDFGLLEGIVSPFIRPDHETDLQGIVQLLWPEELDSQFAAVSITFRQSLFIPLSRYKKILTGFWGDRIPLYFIEY